MHKKPADLRQDRKIRDTMDEALVCTVAEQFSSLVATFSPPLRPSGGLKYLYVWSDDTRKGKHLQL